MPATIVSRSATSFTVQFEVPYADSMLGFEDTRLTYHSQPYEGSRRLLYTLVARRTKPAPQRLPVGEARSAA